MTTISPNACLGTAPTTAPNPGTPLPPSRGAVGGPPNLPADADLALVLNLDNPAVTADAYADAPHERHRAAVLAQYTLYVELTDRLSARRGVANRFFLTVNSAILAVIGVATRGAMAMVSAWGIAMVLAALLIQCAVWAETIASHRRLAAAKWHVVGALERHLPTRPWSRAEWGLLTGKGSSRHTLLTTAELAVPALFGCLYVAAACVAWTTR